MLLISAFYNDVAKLLFSVSYLFYFSLLIIHFIYFISLHCTLKKIILGKQKQYAIQKEHNKASRLVAANEKVYTYKDTNIC